MTDRIASLKGTLARATAEGAAQIAGALRASIRRDVPRDARTLEIGAGARPMFRRAEFPNARILDYYTTEELVRHFQEDYKGQQVTAAQFEPVDYVCKDGDYRAVIGDAARFDVIFSAHALEHQPDLVRHLQTLEGLLEGDGMIVLIVPDKRCTFDVFRQVTTTSDVLAAYAERRRAPAPKAVFDVYAASTAENLGRRITARHKLSFCYDLREALARADEARATDAAAKAGAYADLHNWVFIPDSLAILVIELFQLGLTDLWSPLSSETHGNEFMCVLQRLARPAPGPELDRLNAALTQRRLEWYRQMTFEGGARVLL